MIVFRQNLLFLKRRTFQEITRSMCDFESTSDLFKNYFGLPQHKVKGYITQHRLSQIPSDTILKVIKYCENLGFTKSDMLNTPMLLRLNPSTVDQYYTVMTEGGFVNITPHVLSKYRTWCRKQIRFLKQNCLIDRKTNVAESFIKHLNPPPENFNTDSYRDSLTWCDVHTSVLTEYLKWRLQATSEQIDNLLAVHSAIYRKSFKYLCENIALAEELNFSEDKIIKYGYILRAYPKQTKEILEELPQIAGVSMRKAMRMFPKLMTSSTSNIRAIYDILKKHDIPDEAISKRLNVFHLSPETVDFRLKELKRDTDTKVLFTNPNILRLVVHHNRAKSRLQFLKQLHLKCCSSISLLGNDDNKFDVYINERKDVNTFTDTLAFLKGIFKVDENFESALRRHPHYLEVPLTQMEETYQYLLEKKFSNSAICKVIYILLCPKENIKSSFKQVRQYEKENNRELTQVNKLNLALYFTEKEHHFNGDGVWIKNE